MLTVGEQHCIFVAAFSHESDRADSILHENWKEGLKALFQSNSEVWGTPSVGFIFLSPGFTLEQTPSPN